MGEKRQNFLSRVRVSIVTYVLISLGAVIFGALIACVTSLIRNYRTTLDLSYQCQVVQDAVGIISEDNSKLSETARLYVQTGDPNYVREYVVYSRAAISEKEVLGKFASAGIDISNNGYYKNALDDINQLRDTECYAIKLKGVATGTDIALFSEQISAVGLNANDRLKSSEEKDGAAIEYLFSEEYQKLRANANTNIDNFFSTSVSVLTAQRDIYEKKTMKLFSRAYGLIIAFFVTIAFCFIIITFFLLRPLKKSMSQILAEEGLSEDGVYEVNMMAKTVNQYMSENKRQKQALIEQADHVLEASKQIEAASRMKSDFLANMSHEIRTPMNAVIGMADLALREKMTPEAKDYVSQIKASGKSLVAIINDILDFSKIESGKMDINVAAYNPYDLLSEVSNIISTRIGEKDIELIFDVSPSVPDKLLGDANRIKQIVINLANNAVKFTRSGSVTIIMDSYIDDNVRKLRVDVKDTGIGIKKENLEKIFESFSQVDSTRNRNVEGTGLGLAISKRLTNLMEGDLYVESEHEVGSRFYFIIPQKEADGAKVLSVNNSSTIKIASYIDSKPILEQLKKDADRLKIDYDTTDYSRVLNNITGVKVNAPVVNENKSKNLLFLFVDDTEKLKDIDKLLDMRPSLYVVLMLAYNDGYRPSHDRVLLLKKPVASNAICKLINRISSDGNVDEHTDEENDTMGVEFTAPNARVLIVDDNVVNLRVSRGLLKPLEMQVDMVKSAKDCLKAIETKKYDLIFMDHMMPEMDGVECTKIIRSDYPDYKDVPIVALSANVVEGSRELFLSAGMNDTLAKPIEFGVYVNTVRKYLPPELVEEKPEEESI